MKLFGQLIRTVVNIVVLPVALVKDTRDTFSDSDMSFKRTSDILQKIKDEARED